MATKKKSNRRKKRAKKAAPTTPLTRKGFRDTDHVRSVVLRMGDEFVDALDELCSVNGRSRREIIEILVSEASLEYRGDKSARINPL